MCGRFALSVELIDLPQQFNDTAISHYPYGESDSVDTNSTGASDSVDTSNSNSNNNNGSSNDTASEAPTLHTVDSRHYISSVPISAGSAPGAGGAAAYKKDQYRLVVEIEIKYPQPESVFRPSYNIPPTRTSVIIYQAKPQDRAAPNVDYKYVIESSTFGLVPSWAKPKDPEPVVQKSDGKPGLPYSKELSKFQGRGFNCRKESMGKGNALPTWNSHKRWTRCVVPIQGYFEWKKTKSGDKIPHFIHSSTSSLIYLAGLYSHNRNYKISEADEYYSSFTIVTGSASKTEDVKDMSWLHSRKPVFLNPGSKEWFMWLDPERDWEESLFLDRILDTQKTTAYNDVDAYTVGRSVGKTGSQGKELIEKSDEYSEEAETKSPQKSITSFFSKGTASSGDKKREFESYGGGSPQPKKVKREAPSPQKGGKNDIFAAFSKARKSGSAQGGSEAHIKREKEDE